MLDYILVNEQYYRQISNMVIDEEQLFTPFRIVRKKGKNKITFTDHCAMTLEMICCKGQMESRRTNKQKVWNFTEEGLEKYSRLSNVIAPLPYSKTSTDRFQAWSKVVEGILPKCFKKKTCGKKPRNSKEEKWKARKEIRDIKRGKIQRQVVHEYKKRLHERNLRRLEEQTTKRIKDTVSKLTHKDKFSQSGYWKLKKSITKNRTQKLTSVVSKDGVEVYGDNLIKNEYRKEFQNRLRNREPDELWKEYTNNINQICQLLLENDTQSSPDFTDEELTSAIQKLKRGKSPGSDGLPPELLTRAGKGLLLSLLDVFNTIKSTKEIPDQWNRVLITPIYKNKGSKKELVNYRGIFLTVTVAKVFESILKERISSHIRRMNLHQAGSGPNRSPADNLFLLRGCIDHYRHQNKILYITAYDFQQAFDSLWLQDCILSLERLGVKW